MLLIIKSNVRFSSTAAAAAAAAATVKYPPIEDVSFKGLQRKKRVIREEQVRNVKTVEEKFIKINMPKYWGFRTHMYEEGSIYYNELPHVQYTTRTHVVPEPGLPSSYYQIPPNELDCLVQDVKNSIKAGIEFEYSSLRYEPTQADITDKISKQINRIMLTNLSSKYPHLMGIQTDIDPRVEAFWFCGGLDIPRSVEPLDRPMQYLGNPSLHLRHQLPLQEILPLSECENPAMTVPIMKFDPRIVGHRLTRRHVTSVCGFWPGDACEFGLMSYHKRAYMHNRPAEWNDESDALKTHAVISNYAWLLSLACNLGFSTFNELTYPLVNQMIITNGQYWSFSVYQLNTTLVNGYHCDENPKRNICWITEPMKLFEKLENGKLMGFNDNIVRHLVQFYVNKPKARLNLDMKPYLSSADAVQKVADYEDEEKRIWLEEKYKHLMCNRPRHKLMPEIYHWEWIYKHMFNTRPMDKKRTPWDYNENPFQRRLDEHRPAYVPKAQRTLDMKIRRTRFARNYYP